MNRIGAFDLGRGRSNRVGRALVSYVSDYVRHVTQQAGQGVWDRPDVDQVLDRLCRGKFAEHENHRTSADLVRELIERGFVVDCIYDRAGYLIEDASRYDLILDEWDNLPRWASQNPKSRKCFYGSGCHWLYWNQAELQRLDWLFRRRGAAVAAERQLPSLMGLEVADVATYYGNDYAVPFYGRYQSKLRKLWVCPTVNSTAYPRKDWSSAKGRFLYFGSTSWVHRGLDLVLEAFLKMDLELLICGGDERFIEVYGDELKGRKNIRYLGFVNPATPRFQEIIAETSAVVYASAAEGCSTSVVQCMRFGLIPIVTEATGLSVHDHWPALKGKTDYELIEDITQRCRDLSEYSAERLEELSRWIWDFTDRHHSRAAYRESLGRVLDELTGPSGARS
jgi:hypothetical protein